MGCLEHQEKPKSALLASLKDLAQPVPQAERCWQRQVKGLLPQYPLPSPGLVHAPWLPEGPGHGHSVFLG